MLNILVVREDAASSRTTSIVRALREASYAVGEISPDEKVDAMQDVLAGRPPDVLVADLSTAADCLPLRHVRRLLQDIWGSEAPLPPVLALCRESHLDLPELPAFADDFLLPPYAEHEMLGRIRLLLFRRRQIQKGNTLVLPGVTLHLDSRQAQTPDGRLLSLRPREFDLLQFLATHRGKLFSRERLLDFVWGLDFEGGERTIDIHIRRLREKLPPAAADLLETQRGVGYRLRAG